MRTRRRPIRRDYAAAKDGELQKRFVSIIVCKVQTVKPEDRFCRIAAPNDP